MTHRMLLRQGRAALVGAVAVAMVVNWPLGTGASAEVRTPSATSVGNTYGGLTSEGMPVIVDMTSTRRQVLRAVAAMVLTCTSGDTATVPDVYTKLPVTSAGKFRTAFGPITQRHDDGTTTDYSGRIAGALNDSRTRIAGVWRFVLVEHDAGGTVTDTCDSGVQSWRAKQ